MSSVVWLTDRLVLFFVLYITIRHVLSTMDYYPIIIVRITRASVERSYVISGSSASDVHLSSLKI
jgi:hypothetical protein